MTETIRTDALTVGDVQDALDRLYPPRLAESWDVVGLAVGARRQPVRKINFAVDCTAAVLAEARDGGADLLICHHPPFLRGITAVDTDEPKGRLISAALAAGSSVLVAHTNADLPAFSTVEALADLVGLAGGSGGRRPLVPRGPADLLAVVEGPVGLGRVAELAQPCSLGELADRLVSGLPPTPRGLNVAGDLDRVITRAAVQAGSGDDLFGEAWAAGADVYVTSDLRHHPASDALAFDDAPALIDIPHWAAEWLWLPVAQRELDRILGERAVPSLVSTLCTDPWTSHH